MPTAPSIPHAPKSPQSPHSTSIATPHTPHTPHSPQSPPSIKIPPTSFERTLSELVSAISFMRTEVDIILIRLGRLETRFTQVEQIILDLSQKREEKAGDVIKVVGPMTEEETLHSRGDYACGDAVQVDVLPRKDNNIDQEEVDEEGVATSIGEEKTLPLVGISKASEGSIARGVKTRRSSVEA